MSIPKTFFLVLDRGPLHRYFSISKQKATLPHIYYIIVCFPFQSQLVYLLQNVVGVECTGPSAPQSCAAVLAAFLHRNSAPQFGGAISALYFYTAFPRRINMPHLCAAFSYCSLQFCAALLHCNSRPHLDAALLLAI